MLQTLLATECFYKNVQLLSGSADEHTSLICMIREKKHWGQATSKQKKKCSQTNNLLSSHSFTIATMAKLDYFKYVQKTSYREFVQTSIALLIKYSILMRNRLLYETFI